MFKFIAAGFSLPDFDLSILDTIPIAYKRQGSPVSAVYEELHWLTYSVYPESEISMTRHTQQYLPGVVSYTKDFLNSHFPKLPVHSQRIHFLRTRGKIREHRDEDSRRTAINIGIHNTSTAITRFGVEDSLETFNDNYLDFVCKDGSAYLLDTSKLHSVISLTTDRRTLITLTVTDSYEKTLEYMFG